MKLWFLKALTDPDYDSNHGFVIRAESEYQARNIAQKHYEDEGPIWKNPKSASCEELTGEGEAGIILSDYLAG